jgi:hypothetical protein
MPGSSSGFTAMELILGITLALLVIMALAPLWLSLQRSGTWEADRVIKVMQARVAIARLERDLRLATAGGCLFSTSEAVLEATPTQVVFLCRGTDDGDLLIVEWEVSEGRLMRRWGWCPPSRPTTYTNPLYIDHKTMFEEVAEGSGFCYSVCGRPRLGPISKEELSLIDAVTMRLSVLGDAGAWSSGLSTTAPVGR